MQFARNGVQVLGLDIDATKVDAINASRSYIHHIAADSVAEQVTAGRLSASTDFSRVAECEAIIICVPTPLSKNREPDISYILNTARAIAPHLSRNALTSSSPFAPNEPKALAASPPPHEPKALAAPPRSNDPKALTPEFQAASSEQPVASKLNDHSPLASDMGRGAGGEGPHAPSQSINQQPSSSLQPQASSLQPVLIVLESTTYPGTTDEDLRAVLESGSGLRAGIDFHLAFSPEREDPGNPDSKVATIPKVVGGLTPACLQRAVELYSRAIQTVVPVSSCRAAEATKLLENIFRSVNIALVNELKIVYGAMGIDIWEVIEAAKTKPFGYMPFYPGPGLGGHCIPIDPFYLTWKAREYGQATRFIELAGEINTSMPQHVIRKLAEALNTHKKPLNGSKILLVGLAYKANVDDDRESPGYVLMDLMKAAGAEVAYYDPYIPVIRPSREHSHWAGTKCIDWTQSNIATFDAAVIATAHKNVNYTELVTWSKLVIDTRNATHGLTCIAEVVAA